VLHDEKLTALLPRVEPVLWEYDGLQGKVIAWSKEHENANPDPSVLCWLLHSDGEHTATLQTGAQYQAASMASWLEKALTAYEAAHPRTRVPFVRAEVGGTSEEPRLAALATARGQVPVAVYVGRDRYEDNDKVGKAENRRARAFERTVLGSKKVAEKAEGWTLLRLDLADPLHAALAKTLGVTAAPSIALFPVGAEAAEILDHRTAAHALARLFERRRRADAPATDTAGADEDAAEDEAPDDPGPDDERDGAE
jgi:hypothetical protein